MDKRKNNKEVTNKDGPASAVPFGGVSMDARVTRLGGIVLFFPPGSKDLS